jgi:hypothetical protein
LVVGFVLKDEYLNPVDEAAYAYTKFYRERMLILQHEGKCFEIWHICFFFGRNSKGSAC